MSKNRPAAGARRPSGAEEGEAASAGPPAGWVVTLADDYLGYVFSREQYRAGGMSQHLTIYGEDLGSLLIERLQEIARPCFAGSAAAMRSAEPAGRP